MRSGGRLRRSASARRHSLNCSPRRSAWPSVSHGFHCRGEHPRHAAATAAVLSSCTLCAVHLVEVPPLAGGSDQTCTGPLTRLLHQFSGYLTLQFPVRVMLPRVLLGSDARSESKAPTPSPVLAG